MSRAALTPSEKENALQRVHLAVEALRDAVALCGDCAGLASVSYRALGCTTALLDRLEAIPTTTEEREP